MPSFGQGSISFSGKVQKDPEPPFALDSAINGLSVNSAGQIVLGNDAGDPEAPGRLLDDREILNETGFIQIRQIDPTGNIRSMWGGNFFSALELFPVSGRHKATTMQPGYFTIQDSENRIPALEWGMDGISFGIYGGQIINAPVAYMRMNGLNRGWTVYGSGNMHIGNEVGADPNVRLSIDGALQTTGVFTNGAGRWQFGTLTAGAAVLDAGNYLEVNVNGTLYKLAIVV
jgi:hypothetical protein